jgi:hypothetical protein
MARGPARSSDPNHFVRLANNLLQRLPGAANRAGAHTANWMLQVAKQTTSFTDRTGSLRKSIRAGILKKAAAGDEEIIIALSAGYDDVGYTISHRSGSASGGMRPKSGRVVKTSEYAGAVEMGGYNPWTKGYNPPRPFIQPTAQLADQMGIMAKYFIVEFAALRGVGS